MKLAVFQAKIIDYLMTEIIPNLPAIPFHFGGFQIPLSPSVIQFGAGVGLTMATFNIEKYAPQLKAFGLLDEENNIDIVKFGAALEEQIDQVKSLKIGDFEFDKTDIVKFIEYLKA